MRLTRTVQALSDTVSGLEPETRETLTSVRRAADTFTVFLIVAASLLIADVMADLFRGNR